MKTTKLIECTRQIYRATAIALLLFSMFIVGSPGLVLLRICPYWIKRNLLVPMTSFYSRTILKVMGFKIRQKKANAGVTIRPGTLVISNHTSYLDILLHAAMGPACFISTQEVKEMFFFGTLVQLTGCILIERRRLARIQGEIRDVNDHLNQGMNVMFFPEAKSTNGDALLNFKRPFFVPAIQSRRDVLAVAIRYVKINGIPLCTQSRSEVFWYRQNPILVHLWNLLKLKSVEVEMESELMPYRDDFATEAAHISKRSHALIRGKIIEWSFA